jgi:diazepam-binding inhibitor (GABA receptor modulating acyl-CoA-binding protein)
MADAFETAVADSKKLTSKPGNDELLELYGLYKVATGENIAEAENPGMFDLKGKAKKKAWQKHVDEGLTQDEAKTKYVELVESLKTKYGYDASKEPEAIGGVVPASG